VDDTLLPVAKLRKKNHFAKFIFLFRLFEAEYNQIFEEIKFFRIFAKK